MSGRFGSSRREYVNERRRDKNLAEVAGEVRDAVTGAIMADALVTAAQLRPC
ncbi:hypothetical protein [Cupriavidus sp. YAF13]|uniref:hypothetical protein n=1 Tax=Cupriavidus sp. YAF13 TaxID=3233075 RepID=UPI003F912EFA